MKKFCNCLGGMLIFLCLFGSCSMEGAGFTENTLQEEEGKKEEKAKDANKNDNEDEKKEDDTGDIENPAEEIPPIPEFLSCKAVSETEIVFKFSQPVKITALKFDPELVINEETAEGNDVRIKLAENPKPGMQVKAEFQAEDGHDNIVSGHVTFRTRNDSVPLLQINELRTENENDKLRAEFIELKMISSGNLGALRVYVAGNKDPLLYEFSPVEVKEKDYVVLHLRTYNDSSKDEYGGNLNESVGSDSCSTAFDFWIPGSNKLLHKTDVVYVMDQDDRVLDAVILSDNSSSVWSTGIATAVEFLFSKGIWKSSSGAVCSPADAVSSFGTTATRTICRDEAAGNTHTAANWYVTVTSGATPGQKNNINRYIQGS